MNESEHRKVSGSGWFGFLIAGLILAALLVLWIARSRDSGGLSLSDWSSPGATLETTNEQTSLPVVRYSTPDKFDDVVKFYRKEFELGTGGDSAFTGAGTGFLPFLGGPVASAVLGTGTRPELSSRTLLHRTAKTILVVHISRAKDDSSTSIVMAGGNFDKSAPPPRTVSHAAWAPPAAPRRSGGNVMTIVAYHYAASNSVEQLWSFYVNKAGI